MVGRRIRWTLGRHSVATAIWLYAATTALRHNLADTVADPRWLPAVRRSPPPGRTTQSRTSARIWRSAASLHDRLNFRRRVKSWRVPVWTLTIVLAASLRRKLCAIVVVPNHFSFSFFRCFYCMIFVATFIISPMFEMTLWCRKNNITFTTILNPW